MNTLEPFYPTIPGRLPASLETTESFLAAGFPSWKRVCKAMSGMFIVCFSICFRTDLKALSPTTMRNFLFHLVRCQLVEGQKMRFVSAARWKRKIHKQVLSNTLVSIALTNIAKSHTFLTFCVTWKFVVRDFLYMKNLSNLCPTPIEQMPSVL